MAQERKYEHEDRTYSEWHRAESIMRYIPCRETAKSLAMIDLDVVPYVECTNRYFEPVAIIETARNVGQHKPSTLITNLSKRTYHKCAQCGECSDDGVPSYVVLWTPSDQINPASKDQKWPDIVEFSVRQTNPFHQDDARILTPIEFLRWQEFIRGEGDRRRNRRAENQLAYLTGRPVEKSVGGGLLLQSKAILKMLSPQEREDFAWVMRGFDDHPH